MKKTQVVTWQSPQGETINVSLAQERMLDRAKKWFRDNAGQSFCSVSKGQHLDYPLYSNDEIIRMIETDDPIIS